MSDAIALKRLETRMLDAFEEVQSADVTVEEVAIAILACVATVLHGKISVTRVLFRLTQMFLALDEP